LFNSQGDIDNRVKVLLDALKTPKTCDEIQCSPESGENPFFCLLEDDSIVTSLNVTTDRLLTPIETPEEEADVELIVHVKVIDPGALFGTQGLI